MKIYFVASIAAAEKTGVDYSVITGVLRDLGHKVQDDHIINISLDYVESGNKTTYTEHYKKIVKWMKDADVVVAEVSFPSSINIGHEITLAREYEKPVLALYTKDKSPMMLEGNVDEKFMLEEYDLKDVNSLKRLLENKLEKLISLSDIRFNFFISPKMSRFLEWISKDRMIPKAVFLRRLIEQEIDKAKDFPG